VIRLAETTLCVTIVDFNLAGAAIAHVEEEIARRSMICRYRCCAVKTSNVSSAYAVIVGLELVGDKTYESLFQKVPCIFPCA
jgi:hypothetical protein